MVADFAGYAVFEVAFQPTKWENAGNKS